MLFLTIGIFRRIGIPSRFFRAACCTAFCHSAKAIGDNVPAQQKVLILLLYICFTISPSKLNPPRVAILSAGTTSIRGLNISPAFLPRSSDNASPRPFFRQIRVVPHICPFSRFDLGQPKRSRLPPGVLPVPFYCLFGNFRPTASPCKLKNTG